MKIIEKEITTKEIIIQMTEKELSDIKNKSYRNGIDDTLNYIMYSYKNYGLVKNLAFFLDFIESIAKFCMDKEYMENKNKLTFKDYINRYGKGSNSGCIGKLKSPFT